MSGWRDIARRVIEGFEAGFTGTEAEFRRALREAYPFGQRKAVERYHYKVTGRLYSEEAQMTITDMLP